MPKVFQLSNSPKLLAKKNYALHLSARSRSWTSQKIRSSFIDFFKGHDHEHIPSSSVIPAKGEGTYFTNAGMNQFKPIFLGSCDPTSRLWGVKRAVNSQKCIRVGGKHNDLEDVGHDLTHHTFFEMLGNWSFGDFFKREACQMAYQLLTEHFRLANDRLYFTYFAGDDKFNLPADEECRDIWASMGIPQDRILPFGSRDNFWDMGLMGPCGPCTEIHFDHVGSGNAAAQVNANCPSVVEIWNLVFMQYNRLADQTLEPLPARHVDTGMGLERITAVLNSSQDNYATDLFQPIFSAIQQISNCPTYAGQLTAMDTAYRILADHARMFTVALSDGLLPSNDNLGHKLRGILHKCTQVSRDQFQADPHVLLPALVDVVVLSLGDAFPELCTMQSHVHEVVRSAIDHYDKTIDQASRGFDKMLSRQRPSSTLLSGEAIADLEGGRFGITMSLDVIELLAARRGFRLDRDGYEKWRGENQARESPAVPVVPRVDNFMPDFVNRLMARGVPATDDSAKYIPSPDGIYDAASVAGLPALPVIQGMSCQGQITQELPQGSEGAVVLDQTSFYAESGGQEADTGTLVSEDGVFSVTDVQKFSGYVVHHGHVTKGRLVIGQEVTPCLSMVPRHGNMRNHTGTHLLHAALQDVVPNTQQRGSNISWNRLTFDFLTFSQLESNDLDYIGSKVKECIQAGYSVQTDLVPFSSIQALPDVRYSRHEDYPPEVRLVSVLSDDGQKIVSQELCGGTHAPDTSFLEDFCVTRLGARSQNVKRITCVTGQEAKQAHLNGKLVLGMCELLVSLVSSKERQAELLQPVLSLLVTSEQTKQILEKRMLRLEKDEANFLGVGRLKAQEVKADTKQAMAVAVTLSKSLKDAVADMDQDAGLMLALVKAINKAQQLDLLPKVCRDRAHSCLQQTEHKVSARVASRSTQALLEQVERTFADHPSNSSVPCFIDVTVPLSPRQMVKMASKHSFHKALVLHQSKSGTHHLVVSLPAGTLKPNTPKEEFLSQLLQGFQATSAKARGKLAAASGSVDVYSVSLTGSLTKDSVLSILNSCVHER